MLVTRTGYVFGMSKSAGLKDVIRRIVKPEGLVWSKPNREVIREVRRLGERYSPGTRTIEKYFGKGTVGNEIADALWSGMKAIAKPFGLDY